MKKRDERGTAADPARPAGAATGDVWQPRRGGPGACAIASLVPRITQKSFEKHGFAAASLIMDWAQIVGRDRARDTRPLKLKWPRAVEKFGETAEGCEGRPGAVLVLQVDPAVALDIQYQSAQIIERINAYFGYRAVANLRLVQEVIEAEKNPKNVSKLPAAVATNAAADLPGEMRNRRIGAESDALLEALARLGAHVAARSKQPKSD